MELRKVSQEFLKANATLNIGINPTSLPKLIRLADLSIKRGITTFEKFLLELKLQKIIKNINHLTNEELKILKEAFIEGKNGKFEIYELGENFKKLKPLKVAEEYLGKNQPGLKESFKIENSLFKIKGQNANGGFDYVVLKSGEMRIGKGHYQLSDKANEVLAAGRLDFKNGKIDYIDDWSGHYRPTTKDLVNYVNEFTKKKLTTPTLSIRTVNN